MRAIPLFVALALSATPILAGDPFQYDVLRRGFGVWGIPIDQWPKH